MPEYGVLNYPGTLKPPDTPRAEKGRLLGHDPTFRSYVIYHVVHEDGRTALHVQYASMADIQTEIDRGGAELVTRAHETSGATVQQIQALFAQPLRNPPQSSTLTERTTMVPEGITIIPPEDQ